MGWKGGLQGGAVVFCVVWGRYLGSLKTMILLSFFFFFFWGGVFSGCLVACLKGSLKLCSSIGNARGF